MFTLTPVDAMLLGSGTLAVLTALLLGVFLFLPRSRRLLAAYVSCPVLDRRVTAEVARDEWTRGFCDVVRCDALGRSATVVCNKRCLRRAVAPAT
jgi:hypothetical protein